MIVTQIGLAVCKLRCPRSRPDQTVTQIHNSSLAAPLLRGARDLTTFHGAVFSSMCPSWLFWRGGGAKLPHSLPALWLRVERHV